MEGEGGAEHGRRTGMLPTDGRDQKPRPTRLEMTSRSSRTASGAIALRLFRNSSNSIMIGRHGTALDLTHAIICALLSNFPPLPEVPAQYLGWPTG